MKRLILTLGLLLVSAALLGTSTFAWFSMNKDVAITGMKVKATTPAYVYISNAQNMTDKSNKIALSEAVSSLVPASTADLTSWFTAEAASDNAPTKKGDYKAADTTAYVQKTFYVQSQNKGVNNLKLGNVKITYTGDTASEVNSALRIGIRFSNLVDATDNKTLFFAPKSTATNGTAATGTTTSDTITFVATQSTADEGKSTTVTYNNTASILIAAMDADEVYKLEVFIYFDGEDANCYTQKATVLNDLTIDLGFQAEYVED